MGGSLKPRMLTRGRFTNSSRLRYIILIGLVVLCTVIITTWATRAKKTRAGINVKLREEDHPVIFQSVRQPALDSSEYFERSHAMFQFERQFVDDPSKVEPTRIRCENYSQHLQLLDDDCAGVWFHLLRSSKVIKAEKFWGFEDTHFGAITLVLEGNMRAMFKPCSSFTEDTKNEVILLIWT